MARYFGWPLSVYVDNGSHFVKGLLPGFLAKRGIKLFAAPITNPRSVGLSERYVQLVLAGLRAKVLSDDRVDAKVKWHEHLPSVVQAINTRVLKVHGYTPSQLFMGFNARQDAYDEVLMDEAMKDILEVCIADGGFDDVNLEERQRSGRMAQLAEMREQAREKVLQNQDEQILGYVRHRYASPQVGDLVLLRRFVIDKEKGRKLEPRWEGPYLLKKEAKPGISGYLQDLKTERIKGKYAFDALKVYVPRESRTVNSVEERRSFGAMLDGCCEGWYRGKENVDVLAWDME